MFTYHLIINLVEMNLANFINNLLTFEGDEPEAPEKFNIQNRNEMFNTGWIPPVHFPPQD